jgi:ketosteroid isomerase-like protein
MPLPLLWVICAMDEQDAVLEANQAFYEAFAAGDMPTMEAIWSTGQDLACIHPGWQALVDRNAVMESWRSILASPPPVRCIGARAFVNTTLAHVICYEGIGEGMLVATNIFRKEEGGWRVIHHQAGPATSVQEATPPSDSRVH